MNVTVKFEGGDQIARALDAMTARASRETLRGSLLRAGAPRIRAALEARAPRAPGAPDLAEHMTVTVLRSTSAHGVRIAVGPSNEARSDQPETRYDEQARFLEYGTVHMAMQPFARPVFDSEAPAVLDPIRADLWRQIVEAGGSRGLSTGGGLL